MKNEEKVKEILECKKCHLHKEHKICDNCFDKELLLKMAQWKDEQFKEQIKIIKDNIECMLCVVSGFNDERSHGYQDCGMKIMEMIDKVLNK